MSAKIYNMTDNYNLITISEDHNEFYDTFNIRYRVDIINKLIIRDYYSILNKIIELNKEESGGDIRISISIDDENNPRMNFRTQLLRINEINPDHLFDLVEVNSEDDDNFYISDSTIITIQRSKGII